MLPTRSTALRAGGGGGVEPYFRAHVKISRKRLRWFEEVRVRRALFSASLHLHKVFFAPLFSIYSAHQSVFFRVSFHERPANAALIFEARLLFAGRRKFREVLQSEHQKSDFRFADVRLNTS